MILLDTHALLWWVLGENQDLGRNAREAIAAERSGGEIAISSISAWEIALLVARGRLGLASDVDSWLATVARVDGVRFIPVDNAIAVASVNLPGELHRDPADRMIAATARHFDIALVTGDKKLRAYPYIRTIW